MQKQLDSSFGLAWQTLIRTRYQRPDNGGARFRRAQENGVQAAVPVNGDESGASASFSETFWIFGETLPYKVKSRRLMPPELISSATAADLALSGDGSRRSSRQFGPRARSVDDRDRSFRCPSSGLPRFLNSLRGPERCCFQLLSDVDQLICDRFGNRLGCRHAVQLFPRRIQMKPYCSLADPQNDTGFQSSLAGSRPFQTVEFSSRDKNLLIGIIAIHPELT